jgi:hypothetical protein
MFSINKQVPVIMLSNGNESLGYTKLAGRLNASMLTLKEVQKMKYTELWLN